MLRFHHELAYLCLTETHMVFVFDFCSMMHSNTFLTVFSTSWHGGANQSTLFHIEELSLLPCMCRVACSDLTSQWSPSKLKKKGAQNHVNKERVAKMVPVLTGFAGTTEEALTFRCGGEGHRVAVVIIGADQMMLLEQLVVHTPSEDGIH